MSRKTLRIFWHFCDKFQNFATSRSKDICIYFPAICCQSFYFENNFWITDPWLLLGMFWTPAWTLSSRPMPIRGGVEYARPRKARGQGQRHKKKIRGQGQPFREQTLSRPRTGMLEAKDQGHRYKCSPKEKKVFKNFFQAISKRGKQKRSSQIFPEVSSVFQRRFNNSKK